MNIVDKLAFIDETGDESLNLEQNNISSHYIITGLLIDANRHNEVEEHFKKVKDQYFGNSKEMKSSNRRMDDQKRGEIIEELIRAEFSIYVLVIDKSKLTSTGFQFPKSFIKNLYNRLYSNIMDDFHHVYVKADQIKSRSFMNEFTTYIDKHQKDSLFKTWDFEFVDSQSDVCVQAADFISGTIARGYEKKISKDKHHEYMGIFKKRLGLFWQFPEPYRSYTHGKCEVTYDADDIKIEKRAYAEAYRFLEEKLNGKDLKVREQVICLQAIISHSYCWDSNDWIQTKELRNILRNELGEFDEQKLRGVIGKLKDANVLIASRRKGGYKLPTCKADLYEFIDTQNSKIGPMINRVRKAREVVQRATGVDILDVPSYINLKNAIDASPNWKIDSQQETE